MSTRKVLFNNPAPEEMQVDVHDAAVYVLNGPRRAARKLSVPEYVEEPLFADRAEEAEEEVEEGEVDIVEEKDDFEQIRLERNSCSSTRTLSDRFAALQMDSRKRPCSGRDRDQRKVARTSIRDRLTWAPARHSRKARNDTLYVSGDECEMIEEEDEDFDEDGWEVEEYGSEVDQHDDDGGSDGDDVGLSPRYERNRYVPSRPIRSSSYIRNHRIHRARASRVHGASSLARSGSRRTPISSRVTYSSTARRFAPYSIQKRHYGSRYRSYDTGSRDSYQARGWDAWNNGSSHRPYVADPKMSARFKPWLKCCVATSSHSHKGRGFLPTYRVYDSSNDF